MKKLYFVILLVVVSTTFVSCSSFGTLQDFRDGWNMGVDMRGGSSDEYLK